MTFEINFTLSDPHHHTQFSLRAIHRIHQYTLGGPFNKKFRDELLLESYIPYLQVAVAGNSVPMRQLDATTTVVTLIATEADVAGWNSQGLPRDPVSSENGAIVTASTRWPLMIDPQLQGVAWVKARESGRLQVQRLGQTELIPGQRSAMAGGTTILIENIGEQIDAVLLPLLQRAILTKRDHQYIALGDDEVEYSPGFRLVLHTKLSNPPNQRIIISLVTTSLYPNGI